MTQREFYTAVTTFMNGETPMDAEGKAIATADIATYAEEAIVKLDAANAKKAEKLKEKNSANKPLLDALEAVLTDEPQTASQLTAVIEESVQKTSSLMRKLVAEGRANVQDVKIKGKGTQKGYTRA